MAHILMLGAGVMASALCVPASSNQHSVTLVGSPLDDHIIDSINRSRHHPTLDIHLADRIRAIKNSDCDASLLRSCDIIIIGVSSAGMSWACQKIRQAEANPKLISLVTKGLMPNTSAHAAPLTYSHALPSELNISPQQIVGIAGPCIARELALGMPTQVVFGSKTIESSNSLRKLLQTDTYRIKTTTQVEQLEACAALKNFLCIGVSAMMSIHLLGDSHAKNPLAALFNQAVYELHQLSEWIASANSFQPTVEQLKSDPVAFDLAGLGDLHVTVGGGRNSRLGQHLGSGLELKSVLANQMLNVTVEGVDTGRQLLSSVAAACQSGELRAEELPLSRAILKCIGSEEEFEFDFCSLPS